MKKTKIRTTNLKGTIVFAIIAIILVTFTTFNPTTVYASDNEDVISHYQSVKAEVEKRTDEIKNSTNDMNKAYYSVQTVYNQNGSSTDPDSYIESVSTPSSDTSNSQSGYDEHLAEHQAAIAEHKKEREAFEKEKSVDNEDESLDETETTDEYSSNQENIQQMQEAIMQDYLDKSKEIEEQKQQIEDEQQQIEDQQQIVKERMDKAQNIIDPVFNNMTKLTLPKILFIVLIFIVLGIGAFLLKTVVMSKIFASLRNKKDKDNNSENNKNDSSQSSNNANNNSSDSNLSNNNFASGQNTKTSDTSKPATSNSSTASSKTNTSTQNQQSAHGCVF